MSPLEIERIHQLENNHWWYQSLHSLVLKQSGRRILDLGCGTGSLLHKMQEREHCEALGVDPNERSAALCAALKIPHRQETMQAFLEKYMGDSFDLVLCLDSFYFIAPEEQPKVLAQIWEITASGGKICLHLPALSLFSRGHDYTVGIQKRLSKQEAYSLLARAKIPRSRARVKYRVQMLSVPILLSKLRQKLTQKNRSDLFALPRILNRAFFRWQKWEDSLPTLWGSSIWVEIHKP